MTLVDILIILIVVGIFYVGITYILGLMGITIPQPILILAVILVLLLVFSGQCAMPKIGLGGR